MFDNPAAWSERLGAIWFNGELIMFIPTWAFWILGIVVMLFIAERVSRTTGPYDFVSPLLGVGVILIGIAFAVGYFLGT